MQIHQSAEDYLETILMLTQRMGRVRSIDVVNALGYTKASVSIAMKKLRENGCFSNFFSLLLAIAILVFSCRSGRS